MLPLTIPENNIIIADSSVVVLVANIPHSAIKNKRNITKVTLKPPHKQHPFTKVILVHKSAANPHLQQICSFINKKDNFLYL